MKKEMDAFTDPAQISHDKHTIEIGRNFAGTLKSTGAFIVIFLVLLFFWHAFDAMRDVAIAVAKGKDSPPSIERVLSD